MSPQYSRNFFGGRGEIYYHANFYCYANFLLFLEQISGGRSLRGQTA